MGGPTRRAAVQPGAAQQRRPREKKARKRYVMVRFTNDELEAVQANAAAARLAPGAYLAMLGVRPGGWRSGAIRGSGRADSAVQQKHSGARAAPAVAAAAVAAATAPQMRRALLLELIGIHRQLRGACTNLNQATKKLNSIDEPVGELPAIAQYVRRVAMKVDAAAAALAASRPRR